MQGVAHFRWNALPKYALLDKYPIIRHPCRMDVSCTNYRSQSIRPAVQETVAMSTEIRGRGRCEMWCETHQHSLHRHSQGCKQRQPNLVLVILDLKPEGRTVFLFPLKFAIGTGVKRGVKNRAARNSSTLP